MFNANRYIFNIFCELAITLFEYSFSKIPLNDKSVGKGSLFQ